MRSVQGDSDEFAVAEVQWCSGAVRDIPKNYNIYINIYIIGFCPYPHRRFTATLRRCDLFHNLTDEDDVVSNYTVFDSNAPVTRKVMSKMDTSFIPKVNQGV